MQGFRAGSDPPCPQDCTAQANEVLRILDCFLRAPWCTFCPSMRRKPGLIMSRLPYPLHSCLSSVILNARSTCCCPVVYWNSLLKQQCSASAHGSLHRSSTWSLLPSSCLGLLPSARRRRKLSAWKWKKPLRKGTWRVPRSTRRMPFGKRMSSSTSWSYHPGSMQLCPGMD